MCNSITIHNHLNPVKMKLAKFIIRFDEKEKGVHLEGDRYSYYISASNGVVMTTPFKDKATVLTEGDEVTILPSQKYKLIIVK